jgi:hypothetical protein
MMALMLRLCILPMMTQFCDRLPPFRSRHQMQLVGNCPSGGDTDQRRRLRERRGRQNVAQL